MGQGLDNVSGKTVGAAVGGLFVAGVVFLLRSRVGLGDDDARHMSFAIFALSLVPLVFFLIERLLRSRAVVDIHGIKIDLSQEVASVAEQKVTANIGLPDYARAGLYVNESSTASIADALSDAKRGEILVIDIGIGEDWWVTRLLALCADATRHAQTVLVFKGRCEGVDGAFLGWCTAVEARDAILSKEPSYGEALRAAKQASMLLDLSRGPNPSPFPPPGKYASPKYMDLGESMFEQIALNELIERCEPTAGTPDRKPDKLTLSRLDDLLRKDLRRASLDASEDAAVQLRWVFDAAEPYVGVTREHRYFGLLRRDDAMRRVVRQLAQVDGKKE